MAPSYCYRFEIQAGLSDTQDNELRTLLMKAAMGIPLEPTEQTSAKINRTGFFYVNDSGEAQLVFPAATMLQSLRRCILSCYSMFKEYDKGAAFEFFVGAQLRSQSNVICCLANKPTPVGNSLTTHHHFNGKPEFTIPAVNHVYIKCLRLLSDMSTEL